MLVQPLNFMFEKSGTWAGEKYDNRRAASNKSSQSQSAGEPGGPARFEVNCLALPLVISQDSGPDVARAS